MQIWLQMINKVVDKNEKKSKKYVIFENNTNKMIKQYKNGKELLYHNINNIKMWNLFQTWKSILKYKKNKKIK